MPSRLVYQSAAIVAVQPEVMGTKVGTVHAIEVDANLSQITTTTTGPELGNDYSCCDVDGLTLWHLAPSDIAQLFVDAGASGALEPDGWDNLSILLNEARDKLVFVANGTFSAERYLYVGVGDISATGVVGPPVITNYLRMRQPAINLYAAVGLWERREGSEMRSTVIMTSDFIASKVQWHTCPSIEDIEAGTYKGSHPGCTGVLAVDQGPGLQSFWTHSTAQYAAFSGFQAGNVSSNYIGFLANNGFYFYVPRSWMEATAPQNGFAANWSEDPPEGEEARPFGGVFRVLLGVGEYANHSFPAGEVRERIDITEEADDVTEEVFTPNPPWTEEWTRIYDGGDNDGWFASYGGRPAIYYPPDGLPILLFGVIDGNPTYEDDIGDGEQVYYAKVRGYKWTGSSFALFDTKQGIILRQGDLGFNDHVFQFPESQHIYLIDNEIYFQICMFVGTGGFEDSRSVLTQFGSFLEIESRPSEVSGRVRIVPSQRTA